MQYITDGVPQVVSVGEGLFSYTAVNCVNACMHAGMNAQLKEEHETEMQCKL